jgi:ribosome maturation factor RimP
LPATYEREKKLQAEIAPRIERDLPGVEVLAVELLAPERFCVYVDHPDGVDHALCGRVTDILRDYLREYEVDVSSPGTDRPLRRSEHFARYVGRRVRLRTDEPVDGRTKFKGTIADADGDFLALDVADGERLHIPYASVVRGNLIDEG